jgi:hypothetical protein
MLKDRIKPSEKHRRFIAGLNCCVCGRSDVQCAHIRKGTNGGMGLKPTDNYTVPLCCGCHAEQGHFGERIFWGDNLEAARTLANKLWELTGKHDEASEQVRKFRRAL